MKGVVLKNQNLYSFGGVQKVQAKCRNKTGPKKTYKPTVSTNNTQF